MRRSLASGTNADVIPIPTSDPQTGDLRRPRYRSGSPHTFLHINDTLISPAQWPCPHLLLLPPHPCLSTLPPHTLLSPTYLPPTSRLMLPSKGGAMLIFFEVGGSSESPKEPFQWTLLQPAQVAAGMAAGTSAGAAVWLKPGVGGVWT